MRPEAKLEKRRMRQPSPVRNGRQRIKFRSKESMKEIRSRQKMMLELAPGFSTGDEEVVISAR